MLFRLNWKQVTLTHFWNSIGLCYPLNRKSIVYFWSYAEINQARFLLPRSSFYPVSAVEADINVFILFCTVDRKRQHPFNICMTDIIRICTASTSTRKHYQRSLQWILNRFGFGAEWRYELLSPNGIHPHSLEMEYTSAQLSNLQSLCS